MWWSRGDGSCSVYLWLTLTPKGALTSAEEGLNALGPTSTHCRSSVSASNRAMYLLTAGVAFTVATAFYAPSRAGRLGSGAGIFTPSTAWPTSRRRFAGRGIRRWLSAGVAQAPVNATCLRVINEAQGVSVILTGLPDAVPDAGLQQRDDIFRRLPADSAQAATRSAGLPGSTPPSARPWLRPRDHQANVKSDSLNTLHFSSQ